MILLPSFQTFDTHQSIPCITNGEPWHISRVIDRQSFRGAITLTPSGGQHPSRGWGSTPLVSVGICCVLRIWRKTASIGMFLDDPIAQGTRLLLLVFVKFVNTKICRFQWIKKIWPTLKRKRRRRNIGRWLHRSCQNDKLQYSRWRKFRRNDIYQLNVLTILCKIQPLKYWMLFSKAMDVYIVTYAVYSKSCTITLFPFTAASYKRHVWNCRSFYLFNILTRGFPSQLNSKTNSSHFITACVPATKEALSSQFKKNVTHWE